MAMQYRDSINKVRAAKGGSEAFMQFLEESWKDQDRVREELRGHRRRQTA